MGTNAEVLRPREARVRNGDVDFPVSYGDGKAVFEMEAGRRHHNPMGTVHGGIL